MDLRGLKLEMITKIFGEYNGGELNNFSEKPCLGNYKGMLSDYTYYDDGKGCKMKALMWKVIANDYVYTIFYSCPSIVESKYMALAKTGMNTFTVLEFNSSESETSIEFLHKSLKQEQSKNREKWYKADVDICVMFWHQIKDKEPAIFKRLTGVYKKTFRLMVREVNKYDQKKVKSKCNNRSRPFKLCVEDQILLTLMYYREYRTQFHIGGTYQIS